MSLALPPVCAIRYDLFAVSNHHGQIWGGHYTAFCKAESTGEWWHFDDERVRKVSERTVREEKDAYILFYKLRDS